MQNADAHGRAGLHPASVRPSLQTVLEWSIALCTEFFRSTACSLFLLRVRRLEVLFLLVRFHHARCVTSFFREHRRSHGLLRFGPLAFRHHRVRSDFDSGALLFLPERCSLCPVNLL